MKCVKRFTLDRRRGRLDWPHFSLHSDSCLGVSPESTIVEYLQFNTLTLYYIITDPLHTSQRGNSKKDNLISHLGAWLVHHRSILCMNSLLSPYQSIALSNSRFIREIEICVLFGCQNIDAHQRTIKESSTCKARTFCSW